MKIEVSERWAESDLNMNLVFNFTWALEAVNVTTGYGSGVLIANNTLGTKAPETWVTGDMQMRNSTERREFEIAFNGKDPTHNNLLIDCLECILGYCPLPPVDNDEIEDTPRLWSQWATWGSALPVDGDEVVIDRNWWVLLDIAETPRLKSLEINGRLSFKDDATLPNVKLQSETIFVRAGELIIGASDAPFSQNAFIELLGDSSSDSLTLTGTVAAGNKVLATSGLVELHGLPRSRMSRLEADAPAGATTITVGTGLDWQVGEYIYLAPSTVQETYSEYRTITAISGNVLTLNTALDYYHYGAAVSTAADFNGIDMRTEVFLLTRNVKIQGEDNSNWSGQVLVTDICESDGEVREGSLVMDHVQVYNCSQRDTPNSAIRFEQAVGGSSRISNSAIHHGQDRAMTIL